MAGYLKNKTKQMEQLYIDVACHKFDVLSGSSSQGFAKYPSRKFQLPHISSTYVVQEVYAKHG